MVPHKPRDQHSMATKAVQCLAVRKVEDAWIADPRRFTVKVDPTTDMIDLREIIKQKACKELLIKVDDGLELWLPKEDIGTGLNAAQKVTKDFEDSAFDDLATPVDEEQTVDSIMRNVRTCQSNYIHVMVQVIPPPADTPAPEPQSQDPVDTIAFINQKFRQLLIDTSAAKSPSVNTKSVQYREYQSGPFPILDGRYTPSESSPETQGPPIELFHPIFAEFRALATDTTIEVPSKAISDTASFMRSASAIRPIEDNRTLPSRMALSSILGKCFVRNTNADKTSADHVALGTTKRFSRPEPTALALVEEKGEMGAGGDPSVQGCFSYTKFWLGEDHSEVRKECCCPTFIVALAGSWLTILGAVTTTQYIAQRLTDYLWLGNSRVSDDAHVISIARTLYALRRSLESLDMFYQGLEVQPVANGRLHPRFLPSINSYPSSNTTVRFTYVKPLELGNTCMTFLATLDSGGQDIVVKFVQRYGDAVHRNLASSGIAPELLYYGPIVWDGHSYGELKMVVMGYVQGETLAQRFESEPIPQDVIKAIRDGITTIHDVGSVYGDLRRPNVMIASTVDGNGDADLGKLVRFIDFDWAGKAGDARYPLHLSDVICKTAGTSEYELITKEHDIEMLNAL